MSGKIILAVPLAILALSGCGGSSSSSSVSSSTSVSAPAVTTATAFIEPLKAVSTVASTVPANGDINTYGIVLLPTTIGKLHQGNLLISNFNDKANNQGTGTTIVELTPGGNKSLFSPIRASALPGSCPGGVGQQKRLPVCS